MVNVIPLAPGFSNWSVKFVVNDCTLTGTTYQADPASSTWPYPSAEAQIH